MIKKINADLSLNIPTLITLVGAIISITVFIVSIKGKVDTNTKQLDLLTQEVGELRRQQYLLSDASIRHEKSIKFNEAILMKTKKNK